MLHTVWIGTRFIATPEAFGHANSRNAACGQSAGLIRDVVPVRDVIARLVEEAESTLARLPRTG